MREYTVYMYIYSVYTKQYIRYIDVICKTVFWGGRRMISLSGVNKRLGSFRLKDISIEIPDRYICALVGQNASGKTTLIKMILGLCRPDEGTVVIDGLNYQEAESEKRIRDITTFTFREWKMLWQVLQQI